MLMTAEGRAGTATLVITLLGNTSSGEYFEDRNRCKCNIQYSFKELIKLSYNCAMLCGGRVKGKG